MPDSDMNPFPSRIEATVLKKLGLTYIALAAVCYGVFIYLGWRVVDLPPGQAEATFAVMFFFGYLPSGILKKQSFVLALAELLCAAILSALVFGGAALIGFELIYLFDWTGIHMADWHAAAIFALGGAYGASFGWGVYGKKRSPKG